MVLDSSKLKTVLLVSALLGFVVIGAEPGAVNALPGFSDHTGPSEMEITSLERLDSGCKDDVGTYARGSISGGNYTRVSFLATGDPDADLSAWAERTSPPGTDLSTFRVHVESDSRADAPANASCEMGVQYRIDATTSGASPEGFLPDAYGTRVLWLEDGDYAGCSSSVTSPLRTGCDRFADDERERAWANATSD